MITLKGHPGAWMRWRTVWHAEKHAKHGVEACADLVVTKLLGPALRIDPENNASHARLLVQVQPHPQLAAWREELQRDEKALTGYASKWALRLGFACMLGAEFAGISQLLASQGMVNPQRAIVACAGACILFYLGYQASKEANV
jgi:hypothetical protein